MTGNRERATKPEDLTRLFVELANAGDAEGLAALYEPEAVVAFPPERLTGSANSCARSSASARSPESDPVADRNEAAERAAYNSYLAELAARDKPKQWR